VQEITVDGDVVFSAAPAGAYDITQLTPDTSINLGGSSEHTSIAWNDDGTKMYALSGSPDEINEYNVSTPFEITSVGSSPSASRGAQDERAEGIAWNDDGTQLYSIVRGPDEIYQFNLSTAYDISSASFDTSISTEDSRPHGMAWNDDGSKLYTVHDAFTSAGEKIYEFSVSTPFDISSTALSPSGSIDAEDTQPRGIAWNDDGTRLYEVNETDDKIHQYNLSTPFDITSAGSSPSASINTQESRPQGIAWNNDGSRLYEIGLDGDNVHQYTL
jgi:hypothetical protein